MVSFSKIKIALLIGFALILQACQPFFTVDQTKHYARKIGVINQFEITRWHHRVISANNRISVVSDAVDNVDVIVLSEVIAKGLSPHFNHVQGGESKDTLGGAIALTKVQGSNFLIYVEVADLNAVIEPETVEPTTNYSRMKLILTVVDVVSHTTVEKIVLTTKTSNWNFWGNEMPGLLAKPIDFVGQNLTHSPRRQLVDTVSSYR